MRLRREWPVEAVVAALAGSLVGAALVGAHGDPSLNLHACHVPNGVIHLVSTLDDPNPCVAGEVLDEWSVQGPGNNDGAPGARGPVGAAGPPGPAGSDGHAGPTYSFRVTSASGARSVTARCGSGELALAGGFATRAGPAVTASGRSAPGAWTVEAGSTAARAVRILRARGPSLAAYAVCAGAVER